MIVSGFLGDKELRGIVEKVNDRTFIVDVDGERVLVELEELIPNLFLFKIQGKGALIVKLKNSHEGLVLVSGFYKPINLRSDIRKERALREAEKEVLLLDAPMAGNVARINKKEGDFVKKGEGILVIEAMKMQNEINSPIDGIVHKLFVNVGDKVSRGTHLVEIKRI